MNIQAFKAVALKTASRGLLLTQKHSPVILTTLGVAGVITSTILASRATLKLEDTVDSIQSELADITTAIEQEHISEEDAQKYRVAAYTRGTIKLVKLYGPSVTMSLASIACLVGAHGILQKRNVALAAAYKTLETGFNQYREQVRDEYGMDKDREFIVGGYKTEVIEDEATGKEIEVHHVKDPNKLSIYARFFDETNTVQWEKNAEYNKMFLHAQQNYANDLLHARGHIFLNEVYDMLGLERSKAGQVVGWVVSKDGDNYVDFGMYDFADGNKRSFINGAERAILLDFNVDGVIYDLI